jgi:transposase
VHIQNINKLLNLQGINIVNVSDVVEGIIYITLYPEEHVQPCPCCGSKHVIKRGNSGYRQVRHLPVFGNRTILMLPRIRMSCKDCYASFTWQYSFVTGKSRYTDEFKAYVSKTVTGSTVTHASEVTETPYSTTERIFKDFLDNKISQIKEKVLVAAKETNRLVIGIDDFAIRKGHTYNTGIHDLRNETLLHIIPERKLEELRKDKVNFPEIYKINPVAVVMDLAPYYHTFVKETFPNAIRIADRFHINRYALDALQNLRKRISANLSPRNRAILKQKKFILSKRNDQLTADEKLILEQLLHMSSELKKVYEWKEALIEWYDCCTNINQAEIVFDRWLNYGDSLSIPEVENALKTFKNWRQEIINYHACRFTNAAVEGRNNKIKALQRRHYFTRNKKYYDARLMLECNSDFLTA